MIPTRPPFRSIRGLLALVLGSLVAGCASDPFGEPVEFAAPATLIDYTPVLTGAPSEEIADLMEESLLVFRREDDGAQSVAFLRRRAEGDIPTAQKILRSYGYYAATVETRVSAVGEPDAEGNPTAAVAEIVIEPGAAFTLARHDAILTETGPQGAPDLAPLAELGSPVGGPAEAQRILDGEIAAVAALRGSGRPYAERDGRRAVADRDAATLEVETTIATGPAYVFGPITFSGAPDVEDDYLLTYLPWAEGDVVDTALLASFQRRLMGTRLFRSGAVTLPETPPEGEAAPVTVELEQAPFRTVKAGVRYNTDEGPGVRLGFEHRNLFGSNEQIDLSADASFDEQVIESKFRKPQYLRPWQDFVAGLELRRLEEDAYDELGGTATAGIERRLNPRWTVGFGLLGEYSHITDQGVTNDAILGGVPLFAAYDGSDDLLDPTRGARFRIDATPFAGQFAGAFTTFLSLDARASAYFPLTSDGGTVFATRARLGSVVSSDFSDVPATRRLYSGGGGSVRGYAEDFIGPLDSSGDPIGGRSVTEVGAEIRGKVWGDLALAAFVEAGSVTEDIAPTFTEGMQVAAGGGIRYHSPIGPIRLDVGVPLNPRDEDDSFQVYISIGQAF